MRGKAAIADVNIEMARFPSVVGPSWPGLTGLKHLVIFGDSYSSVGYHPKCPHPTVEEPLGVEFPGMTWADEDEESGDSSNWVGHLIKLRNAVDATLIVYDYAVGGHTINGVRSQIRNWFLPTAGMRPEWAPWAAEDTLFVTWVGVNDCAYSRDHAGNISRLFELQEEVYEAGARNFLFIDVPPIHRTPAVSEYRSLDPNVSMSYDNWNAHLHRAAKAFHASHPEITVLMFSAWDSFTSMLDDPPAFGFPVEDRRRRGGKMWVDHIHPTSRVHEVIARDVERFLSEFSKYGTAAGEITIVEAEAAAL